MNLLITNDDGIYSPGILALARVASKFGHVRIVAPDVEQSAMSAAITSTRPLSYRKTPLGDFEAFRVNGTPSDCVALGTHLWERVDVVLSGINLGPNVGNGIWHSGTVSAARQSVLLGCRGIAFSTPVTDEEPRFETLEPFVERALELLLADTSLRLVNVNLPQHPTGVAWTRVSVRQYDGWVVPGKDPLGRDHFWFTVKPLEPADEGTDRWALEHDLVSMTPLRLDLTDEECLKKTKEQAAAEARPREGQPIGKI